MQVKLTRKSAGFYTVNVCGEQFTITTFEGVGGGWIIYSQSDPLGYSDPIPTLRDCRLAIADMTTRRGAAKAWSSLSIIATAALHRETLVKYAAMALKVRMVDLSDAFNVWDVIDEYGRKQGNTFYSADEFDYDGKNGDDLIADVKAAVRAIRGQPVIVG